MPLARVQVGRVVESFTLRLTPPAPILDNETLVMGAIASDNASDTWAVAIPELRLIYDWSGARSVYLDLLNTTLWSSRGGYARAKPDISRAPFIAARSPWAMSQHGTPATLRAYRTFYLGTGNATGLEAEPRGGRRDIGGEAVIIGTSCAAVVLGTSHMRSAPVLLRTLYTYVSHVESNVIADARAGAIASTCSQIGPQQRATWTQAFGPFGYLPGLRADVSLERAGLLALAVLCLRRRHNRENAVKASAKVTSHKKGQTSHKKGQTSHKKGQRSLVSGTHATGRSRTEATDVEAIRLQPRSQQALRSQAPVAPGLLSSHHSGDYSVPVTRVDDSAVVTPADTTLSTSAMLPCAPRPLVDIQVRSKSLSCESKQ